MANNTIITFDEPPINPVLSQAGVLTGAVPTGKLVGVDTDTGKLYYPAAGVWAEVPVAVSTETITQANSFVSEQIIQKNNGITWELAQANAISTLGGLAVLSATPTEFVAPKTSGFTTITGHSYGTSGQDIYLSDVLAGGTLNSPPAANKVKIGYVVDANTVYFNNSGLGVV